jgi:membrane protein YqaA with SNARE-associated domain
MVVGIAWAAGAVKGHALGRRRAGAVACRDLARRASLDDVLRALQPGPYGHDLATHMTLPEAQWAVGATPLWHMRVLAGWLPPAGGDLVTTLAGWWEVRNVENHLAGLTGGDRFLPYELGRLGTAWGQLGATQSPAALRRELARSRWLDPGDDAPGAIVTWLHLSWADRVAQQADEAGTLAGGWAALAAARTLRGGPGTGDGWPGHGIRVLGTDWFRARDVPDLAARLPRPAGWVLEGITDASELWRAELRWWRRLERQGGEWLQQRRSGREVVLGVFGVLVADAHCVAGALELAARGGAGRGVVDELV